MAGRRFSKGTLRGGGALLVIRCGGVEAGPLGERLAIVEGCWVFGSGGFVGRAPLGALCCGCRFFVIRGGASFCGGPPAAFLCGDALFVSGGGGEGRAAPEVGGCFWDVFFASSGGGEGRPLPEAAGCFWAVCGARTNLGV